MFVVVQRQIRYENNGAWASFVVGVGMLLQFANILISKMLNQPWLVVPQERNSHEGDLESYPFDGGRIYDPEQSTSWVPKRSYSLHAKHD